MSDSGTLLALIKAELVRSTEGTSTLVRRSEWQDSLLDLQEAVKDYATIRALEADLKRKTSQRRLRDR